MALEGSLDNLAGQLELGLDKYRYQSIRVESKPLRPKTARATEGQRLL